MISEYHRPTTVEEALALLGRTDRLTVPLAGGSALNRPSRESFVVVDLQALGLDTIEKRGNLLVMGATATLQTLLESGDLPPALQRAILHEAAYNLRQVATVAGTLVAADGRSPFTTVLLAADATITWQSSAAAAPISGQDAEEDGVITLGDLLPLRAERLRGRLITQVTLPLNASLGYEYVARSPADRPVVCVGAAAWPSGRTRIALGGYGPAPLLALDGPEPSGVEAAMRNAYSHAGDEWASAEYRQETAAILAKRILEQFSGA